MTDDELLSLKRRLHNVKSIDEFNAIRRDFTKASLKDGVKKTDILKLWILICETVKEERHQLQVLEHQDALRRVKARGEAQ